jgi:small conductance mechanosensitive channel
MRYRAFVSSTFEDLKDHRTNCPFTAFFGTLLSTQKGLLNSYSLPMHLKISPVFGLILVLALGAAMTSLDTYASEKDQAEAADNSQEQVFAKALADIENQKRIIEDLGSRVGKASGIMQLALESRLSKAKMSLLEQNLSFADAVAGQENADTMNDKLHQQAIEILGSQLKLARVFAGDIREKIVFSEEKLSAAEQAAMYSKIFELLDRLNHSYEIYIASLKLARHFELDVSKQEELLKEDLAERAANGSIFLEMTLADVTALRASTAVVPDDAELNAKLNAAINHVSLITGGIAAVLAMMDSLEMDTSVYQEQLLGATGQITKDFFEVGVLTSLLTGWGETLWLTLVENGPGLFFQLILFLLIVFAFYKLANLAKRLTEAALQNSEVELSQLLQRMVLLTVRNTVLVIGVLIALSQVGISLGPLLAGLGVLGFIVGFALQDTLSNFAAGLLILLYRPFDVDDFIDAAGVSGLVSHMSLVNTTILTLDNQTIIVPNGKIWGDVIKNMTAQSMRRIDMVFGISYTDDIPKTEKLLQEIVSSNESVLNHPEPIIRLHELGDSSVNFVVRPWVNTADYWETYWAITRAVKIRFDEEGISIPFPQRDVHLHQT